MKTIRRKNITEPLKYKGQLYTFFTTLERKADEDCIKVIPIMPRWEKHTKNPLHLRSMAENPPQKPTEYFYKPLTQSLN